MPPLSLIVRDNKRYSRAANINKISDRTTRHPRQTHETRKSEDSEQNQTQIQRKRAFKNNPIPRIKAPSTNQNHSWPNNIFFDQQNIPIVKDPTPTQCDTTSQYVVRRLRAVVRHLSCVLSSIPRFLSQPTPTSSLTPTLTATPTPIQQPNTSFNANSNANRITQHRLQHANARTKTNLTASTSTPPITTPPSPTPTPTPTPTLIAKHSHHQPANIKTNTEVNTRKPTTQTTASTPNQNHNNGEDNGKPDNGINNKY